MRSKEQQEAKRHRHSPQRTLKLTVDPRWRKVATKEVPRFLAELDLEKLAKTLAPDGPEAIEEDESTESEYEADGAIRTLKEKREARCQAQRLRRYVEDFGSSEGVLRALSHLERKSISKKALKRYQNRFESLLSWMRSSGATSNTAADLDRAMTQYVNELYLKGHGSHIGAETLAAIGLFLPEVLSSAVKPLPHTLRSLKGWRLLCPSHSRRPWPWAIWCGIAALVSQESPRMGLAILIAVDLYLRITELIQARCGDLLKPTVHGLQSWVLVLFPRHRERRSKVGQFDDTLAFDSKRLQWISAALHHIARLPGADSLCGSDYAGFIKSFNAAARRLGVKVKPSEMRHSGASLDRAHDLRPLLEIQRRGRWFAASSVRRYEKRGLVNESWEMVNSRAKQFCQDCEANIEAILLRGAPPPTLS